jgi:hypothetical protein
MSFVMTPSEFKPTTDEQVNKAVDVYRAMLVKHQSEWPYDAFQVAVLGASSYVGDQLGMIRRRIEAIVSMVTRVVQADGALTAQKALDATGRHQYTNREVVDSMPRGKDGPTTVYFFKPRPEAYDKNSLISDEKLEEEYAFFGLAPVDPFTLAKVEEEPSFADEHPNGTHWKDANDHWCYAAFYRWLDERRVRVDRDDDAWHGHWWFSGVPASRK